MVLKRGGTFQKSVSSFFTGRVINVTSVKGRIYYPCISAYGVTKHGIETFSDCLRVEMARFGVKVSLVEPGNFSACTAIVKGENVRLSQKNGVSLHLFYMDPRHLLGKLSNSYMNDVRQVAFLLF